MGSSKGIYSLYLTGISSNRPVIPILEFAKSGGTKQILLA
jgi:hypothetical protein